MKHNLKCIAFSLVAFAAALTWATGTAAALAVTSDSGISFSGDALYWRPSGLDTAVASPLNPVNIAQTPGQAQGFEYGFAPGYRLQADWKDWRVSWVDIAADNQFSASCPGGCDALGAANKMLSVGAGSDVRMQVADLEFRQPFADYAESSKRTLYWALGARFVHLRNDVTYNYLGWGLVAANSVTSYQHLANDMYGLRAAIEGKYGISSAFTLSGNAGLSLMTGHSVYTQSSVFSAAGVPSAPVDTGANVNHIVPVWELGAKLSYSPLKDLDVSVGYDFMEFRDALFGVYNINNSAAGGPFPPYGFRYSRTISFQGPRAGISWRFE